jgi:hypothetical protein
MKILQPYFSISFSLQPSAFSIAIVVALATATLLAHDPITTRVTWTGEVSRIVEARCVMCHNPSGPAPMSLQSYDEARPWAKAIKEAVLTRHMPNWRAVRGYGDFSNDPSLSPFEIALVAAWADGGAPERLRPPSPTGYGETSPKLKAEAGPERGAGGQPAAGRPPSESERGWDPASIDKRRQLSRITQTTRPGRTTTLPCGTQPVPRGTLLAIQPTLPKERSVGVALTFPDGRREIVAWIRGYDPAYPTTYRLRTPLTLPAGTILSSDAQPGCAITLTLKR